MNNAYTRISPTEFMVGPLLLGRRRVVQNFFCKTDQSRFQASNPRRLDLPECPMLLSSRLCLAGGVQRRVDERKIYLNMNA